MRARVTKSTPLSDCGYLWEYRLRQKGFHKLPVEQQWLNVINYCPATRTFLVEFDGMELILYPNEIVLEQDLDEVAERAG